MSARELAVVFCVLFLIQLAVNGWLAWKVRQMDNWFREVINNGYRKSLK